MDKGKNIGNLLNHTYGEKEWWQSTITTYGEMREILHQIASRFESHAGLLDHQI
jgi:hypothetical protein